MSAHASLGERESDKTTEPPRIDALIASERGAPDGWQISQMERIGTRPHAATMIRGYVPGGQRQEFLITDAEHDARRARWESDTGNCSKCGGDGREVWSVGVDGVKTRTCSRCKGNGKAPTFPEVA